eukprot:tig00000459_g1061.t1
MSVPGEVAQGQGAFRPFVPILVARLLPETLHTPGPQSFGFEAACVMVDISGSVELAHALLERGGTDFDMGFVPSDNRGADELSSRLNGIFREVLRIARQYGADVVRYPRPAPPPPPPPRPPALPATPGPAREFLGDAILCLCYADEVLVPPARSSLACPPDRPRPASAQASGGLPAATRRAAAMSVDMLGVETERLRLHLAMSAGTHYALKLGGHRGKFDLSVVGNPLADLAQGLSLARSGEIGISERAVAVMGAAEAAGSLRGGYWVVSQSALRLALSPIMSAAADPAPRAAAEAPAVQSLRRFSLSAEAAAVGASPAALAAGDGPGSYRPFVPPDVEACIDREASFVTELRIVTCVFVRLGEFQCPPRPPFPGETVAWLHKSVHAIQEAVASTAGVIRSFFRDDKGFIALVTYGLVGTAHGDDPLRACAAAVRIREAFKARALGQVSIGVATGRVFAGFAGCAPAPPRPAPPPLVGDSYRCDYNVLGDSVNVAARLMGAHDGDVLVDRPTRDAVHSEIHSEALPPLHVKGKKAALEAFRLGARVNRQSMRSLGTLGQSDSAMNAAWEVSADDEDEDGEEGEAGGDATRGDEAAGARVFEGRRRNSRKRSSVATATAMDLASSIREEAASARSLVRGRAVPVGHLCDFLTAAAWKPGGAGVLFVTAEAGAGKSALANECLRLADRAGIPCLVASGDSLETSRLYFLPYHAFQDVLQALWRRSGRGAHPSGDPPRRARPRSAPARRRRRALPRGRGPAPAAAAAAGAGARRGSVVTTQDGSGVSGVAADMLQRGHPPGGPPVEHPPRPAPAPLRTDETKRGPRPPPRKPAGAPPASSFTSIPAPSRRRAAPPPPRAQQPTRKPAAMQPPSPRRLPLAPALPPGAPSSTISTRNVHVVPRSRTSVSMPAPRPPEPLVPDSNDIDTLSPEELTEDSPALIRARRFLFAINPHLATRANAALLEQLLPSSGAERLPLSPHGHGHAYHGHAHATRPEPHNQAGILLLMTSVFKAVLRSLRAVLVVEDLHLLDSASVRLVENLAHSSGSSILVTCRSNLAKVGDNVAMCPRTRNVELSPLTPEETAQVVGMHLNINPGQIPPWFAASLCDQARGNPFAVSEIVSFLSRRELLRVTPGDPDGGDEEGATPRPGAAPGSGTLGAAGESRRPSSAKHAESRKASMAGGSGAGQYPVLHIDESLGDADRRNRLPVPDSLERLILSRLDALPPVAALACKLFSVLGTRFTLGMAMEVLSNDIDPPALIHCFHTLEAARLIGRPPASPHAGDQGAAEYAFVQGLVAEALYRLLPAEDRNRIHRLCAEWLERQEKPDVAHLEGPGEGPRRPTRAALLAYHWLRSGDAAAVRPAPPRPARQLASQLALPRPSLHPTFPDPSPRASPFAPPRPAAS